MTVVGLDAGCWPLRWAHWGRGPNGGRWRQRYRWCYGTLQSAWKHRRALVERRAIGPVGISYGLAFHVVLALLAPLIDVAALFGLLAGDARAFGLAWLAFTAAQLVLAVVAFRLDGESIRPLWALPAQQFFYRQLMYLVAIQSVATARSGTRLRWHKLRRLGAGEPTVAVRASLSRRMELAPWAAHTRTEAVGATEQPRDRPSRARQAQHHHADAT